MNTPDPEATLSGTLALASDDEWDDATLATLHHDDAPVTAELVAVPGYTQTGWERQMVTWLQRAEACEDYLLANQDKPDCLLVYDLLVLLGSTNAAAEQWTAVMSPPPRAVTAADEGTLYAELLTPKPKPKPAAKRRPRPSRARKTAINGGA